MTEETRTPHDCAGYFGIVISDDLPLGLPQGSFIYASVEAVPKGYWKPWPGKWHRWWFEVGYYVAGDDLPYTAAYDGHSGGGFTLLQTIHRARKSMNDLDEKLDTPEAKARRDKQWEKFLRQSGVADGA